MVGQIVRPIGLRGEVVVDPAGDDPKRFAGGALFVAQGGGPAELRVAASRPYRERIVVRFEGIDSVEVAEALRDVRLYVPEASLPSLPAGVYYHYQVMGLTVFDSEGVEMGKLESILNLKSNEVYCVRGEWGEILIPAVREYIEKVDPTGGRITLRVPRSALGMDEEPV